MWYPLAIRWIIVAGSLLDDALILCIFNVGTHHPHRDELGIQHIHSQSQIVEQNFIRIIIQICLSKIIIEKLICVYNH